MDDRPVQESKAVVAAEGARVRATGVSQAQALHDQSDYAVDTGFLLLQTQLEADILGSDHRVLALVHTTAYTAGPTADVLLVMDEVVKC